MRSTSPRHAGPARAAHGRATGAPEAEEGAARSHRRRRGRLLLIVAPVAAVLVALLGLAGMHVVTWPTQVTADSSQHDAAESVVNALSAAALACCHTPVTTTPAPAGPPPSASPRHHPAGRSSPRHHPAVKATPSAPASPAAASTSPPTSVPGWQLTYSTDFPGNSLPSGWGAYDGAPGGDPYGNWDSSNVSVSGGALHLMATSWAQAGVSFYGDTQEYGMYLVRMKGDYEPGLQISDIALLWPAEQGVWPPEIDFYEDGGGSRSGFTASLHPGSNGDDCCVIRHMMSNDGTQWHTYGVIWTPDSITYTIDGTPWATVQQDEVSYPGSWPAMPMILDLQSQNLGPAQPSQPIETMTVAWVAEYAQTS